MRMHIKEAKAAGYEVDTRIYPPRAYKGSYFLPTEKHDCFTELESLMLTALRAAKEELLRLHVVRPNEGQTGFKEVRLVVVAIDLAEML